MTALSKHIQQALYRLLIGQVNNTIKFSLLLITAWLCSFLLAAQPTAYAQDIALPELGDSGAGLMSAKQERELGQAWLRSFRASVRTSSDPLIYEYTESLLFKLSSYSPLENKDLSLVVVDNPTINAFAVPGGVVGVHTGLFLSAQTEDQFSSVLAHELAHLSQRHFARGVEASKNANFVNMAGLLASILIAATAGGDAASAAIISSQAIALDSRLRYSRRFEREADRIGMKTLHDAGYPAEAAAEMFKQMLNTSRLYGNKIPEFLLTHPVTQSRVSDASNRARQFDHQPSKVHIDYNIIRARVKVLTEEKLADSIKYFKHKLKNNTDDIAAVYGLALAYNHNHQAQKASQTIAKIPAEHSNRISISLLKVEIDIEAGKIKKALKKLEELKNLTPNNYPINMLYAKTLLDAKKYNAAEQVLSHLTQVRPKQPDVWYLLAEAYGLNGNILALHQARAEYFTQHGLFQTALKHLQHAENLAGKNYQVVAKIQEQEKKVIRLMRKTREL